MNYPGAEPRSIAAAKAEELHPHRGQETPGQSPGELRLKTDKLKMGEKNIKQTNRMLVKVAFVPCLIVIGVGVILSVWPDLNGETRLKIRFFKSN